MGPESNKKSGEMQPISEGLKAIEASRKSVQAKLGNLWSEIKGTVSSSAKEYMTKVELLRPFSAHMNEVRKIIALKTYGRGSGDWREINKKLASLNITKKDISKLQAYLKLVPDGHMGPHTIEGLTRLLGEQQKITLARKTTVNTERIEAIKKQEIAQAAPAQQPAPAPVAVLPAVPTNPNDAADAPVDTETDDNSYTEEAEVAEEDVPMLNEGLLLSREQAVTEAFKILTKGKLNSNNYSKEKREAWAKDIVTQMEATGISLTRQHILMIAVTIDRESGFKEVPVVNNPEAILDRKIAEYKKEYPYIYSKLEDRVAPYRQMAIKFINERRDANLKNGIYRKTSSGKRVGYFTEKDVDLAIDYALKQHEELSWPLQKLITKDYIEKHRPKTSGAMQVNVGKAIELAAKYDHKQISEPAMRDILNTREGGLRYGLYYMKEVLSSHEQQGPLDEKNVKFAFLDYNMGAFSARNAGIQTNLNKLKNVKLDVDGDLLMYEANGKPLDKESNTEDAIQDILDDNGVEITDEQVRHDLLKEKSKDFESTRTYRELAALFTRKNLPLAKVIPNVKAKGGKVKFGSSKINTTGYVAGSYRRYKRLGSV